MVIVTLMVVTMGPSVPGNTIVWPNLSLPFTRHTSIVVPKPPIAFTSRIVHCSSSV